MDKANRSAIRKAWDSTDKTNGNQKDYTCKEVDNIQIVTEIVVLNEIIDMQIYWDGYGDCDFKEGVETLQEKLRERVDKLMKENNDRNIP